MDIDAFISRYPRLFHMAERDSWPSIRHRGLLSTTAVLDLAGINGKPREAFEVMHRPEKIVVQGNGVEIMLRDQKPMEPNRLQMGLRDGITPSEWYELINHKVFMWAQERRLLGLLGARHYRILEHDVLTIDTEGLLGVHANSIWLCPMNSGNTFPIPHSRGKNTFLRIPDYPVGRSGRPTKEVVEVVIDYSIPDIADHVVEVRRMRGAEVLENLPV